MLLWFQVAMENIHAETYSLLIDTFIKDNEEKTNLFNALETVPCVKRRRNGLCVGLTRRLPLLTAWWLSVRWKVFSFRGSFCSIFLAQEAWSHERA